VAATFVRDSRDSEIVEATKVVDAAKAVRAAVNVPAVGRSNNV
jgi:hypothetical protein